MNRNRLWIVAFVLVSALAFCAVAEACPGCAEAQAGQGAERSGIVRGYMYSIIFMLSMPFMIFGGFGIYVYRHVRRTKLAAEAAVAMDAQDEAVAKSQAVPDAGVLTSA
jgi:heme/copper-type cytochrome/quinol oxidase subunit 2